MSPTNIIRVLVAAAATVIMLGAGLVWAGDADAARARIAAHCIEWEIDPPAVRECPAPKIPAAPKLRSTGPGADNHADPTPWTYAPATPTLRKPLPAPAPVAAAPEPEPCPDDDAVVETPADDTEGEN